MNFQLSKNQVYLTSASAISLLSLYTVYRYKTPIYNYLSSFVSSKNKD